MNLASHHCATPQLHHSRTSRHREPPSSSATAAPPHILQPPSRVIFSARKPWQQLHARTSVFVPHLQPCSQQHHLRTTLVSEPRTRTNLQQRRRNAKQQHNHWICTIPHPWSASITHSPQICNSSRFHVATTTASSTIDAASSLLEKRSSRHCTLHL